MLQTQPLPAAVKKPILTLSAQHLHFWGILPLLQLPLSSLAAAWLITDVSALNPESMAAANTLRLDWRYHQLLCIGHIKHA